MTVALGSLAALLAVALAVVVWRLLHTARAHEQLLLEADNVRRTVESQLDETREALQETEGRLRAGEARAEIAERLRLQREWAELAGPAVDLPVAWDGSLASTAASELEVIREVVGTPATIELDGQEGSGGGSRLALGAEFLRAAAMDADEMQVRVGDCVVVVDGSSGPSAVPVRTPHLDSVKLLMQAAGAELVIETSDGGFRATLRFGD